MKQAPFHNASVPYFMVQTGSGLFRLLIGSLVATGAVLWSSTLVRLFEGISLEILYLHCLAGIVFCFVLARALSKSVAGFSVSTVWSFPFFPGGSRFSPVVSRLMALAVAALLFSGAGLLFARFAPRVLTGACLYVHGTAGLLFIALLGPSAFSSVAAKLRQWRRPAIEKKELPGTIKPGVFEQPQANWTIENRTERFLQVFGTILKKSGLRLFIEDYKRAVPGRDIFQDGKSCIAAREKTRPEFTPGDYLISIYRKYFTISGWIQRGLFSGKGLTAKHLEDMCSLCFGYIVNGASMDRDDGLARQGLMAKYGRFIFAEMGILPAACSSDLSIMRSFKRVEEKIEKMTGKRISLNLDKKNTDIVLFPSVEFLLPETDTLQWLAVVLDALRCDWTIGKAFFDGFGYGAFFGDWFVDRILDCLTAKARELNAEKIVLCVRPEESIQDPGGMIVDVNDLVLKAVAQGTLQFRKNIPYHVVGHAGFFGDGCNVKEPGPLKILQSIGVPLVEIEVSEVHGSSKNAIREKNPDIIVTPFWDSRERLKYRMQQNNIDVEVVSLYEMLAKVIQRIDA